jgi:hypothetical protein
MVKFEPSEVQLKLIEEERFSVASTKKPALLTKSALKKSRPLFKFNFKATEPLSPAPGIESKI